MQRPNQPYRSSRLLASVSLVYVLLIVYASLFPFNWHMPLAWSDPLTHPWPHHDASSDILVNVVAYAPLGVLLTVLWRRMGPFGASGLALLAGAGLSLSMEFLQEALPGRVSSVADFVHNVLGVLLGLIVARFVSTETLTGLALHKWRERLVMPGPLATVGAIAVLAWMAAELFPWVPSPGMTTLKYSLRPLLETLSHPAAFSGAQTLGDVFELVGIGLFAQAVFRVQRPFWFGLLLIGVALLKIVVVYQVLSLEYLLASVLSFFLLALSGWQTRARRLALALVCVLGSLVVDELRGPSAAHVHAFNWVPFAAQIGTLPGLNGLLVTLWIGLSVSTAARWLVLDKASLQRGVQVLGGAAFFALWFALEWHQRGMAGKVPDITNPLVGLVIWGFVWVLPMPSHAPVARASAPATD